MSGLEKKHVVGLNDLFLRRKRSSLLFIRALNRQIQIKKMIQIQRYRIIKNFGVLKEGRLSHLLDVQNRLSDLAEVNL